MRIMRLVKRIAFEQGWIACQRAMRRANKTQAKRSK